MIYWQLLWSFLQVGLFSFGGGYGVLPVIQQQVVTQNHWLTVKEFTDVITISQMTPGPIALNAATFVGIKTAGPLGAVIATLGCSLPTAILALIIGHYYYKYRDMRMMKGVFNSLRPAIVSLIASAGLSILYLAFFNSETFGTGMFSAFDWKAAAIFVVCIVLLRKWKLNPTWVILGSGAAGAAVYLIK